MILCLPIDGKFIESLAHSSDPLCYHRAWDLSLRKQIEGKHSKLDSPWRLLLREDERKEERKREGEEEEERRRKGAGARKESEKEEREEKKKNGRGGEKGEKEEEMVSHLSTKKTCLSIDLHWF